MIVEVILYLEFEDKDPDLAQAIREAYPLDHFVCYRTNTRAFAGKIKKYSWRDFTQYWRKPTQEKSEETQTNEQEP